MTPGDQLGGGWSRSCDQRIIPSADGLLVDEDGFDAEPTFDGFNFVCL